MNEDRIRALVDELYALTRPSAAPEGLIASPAPSPAAYDRAEQAFTDYGKFYDYLRSNKLLGPTISKNEFEGCDAIITACVRELYPVSYTAYALGTSYLETAATMQPIKEKGGTAYFTRMYDIKGARPSKAKELGNLTPGDGAKYPGMGYVQLTGLKNYQKATAKLRALGMDVDLVAHPEQAMRPDVAALVMAIGMKEGWFTTRKLSDDLPPSGPATLPQLVASRDIINGKDRQEDVAAFAFQFQTGLVAAGYHLAA